MVQGVGKKCLWILKGKEASNCEELRSDGLQENWELHFRIETYNNRMLDMIPWGPNQIFHHPRDAQECVTSNSGCQANPATLELDLLRHSGLLTDQLKARQFRGKARLLIFRVTTFLAQDLIVQAMTSCEALSDCAQSPEPWLLPWWMCGVDVVLHAYTAFKTISVGSKHWKNQALSFCQSWLFELLLSLVFHQKHKLDDRDLTWPEKWWRPGTKAKLFNRGWTGRLFLSNKSTNLRSNFELLSTLGRRIDTEFKRVYPQQTRLETTPLLPGFLYERFASTVESISCSMGSMGVFHTVRLCACHLATTWVDLYSFSSKITTVL